MAIGKKQTTFRGKTLEELKELDVREFAKLLKSRARRTVLRNFQEIERFVFRAKKKAAKGKPIKTHSRDLVIVPELVGMKLQVHSGNKFTPFEVTLEMLGHKFGEFALTRGRVAHSKAGVGATKGTKAKAKH
jgi:small subunit ribosomal protein S19